MSHIFLFLDTETTGNQPEDRLCQLAYKCSDTGEVCDELFKPPLPISVESSAVCHITNRMVADKPVFVGSDAHATLKRFFTDPDMITVAHNAQFDLEMLRKEALTPGRHICTLKVARDLDQEGVIPRYNLQYLRYYYDFDVEATAHDALGDVVVLERLFNHLLKQVMEKKNIDESTAIEYMIEVSSKPSVIKMFNFGKYNGQKISDVATTDRGYLTWLYNQKMQNPSMEEDWLYTLKQFI